MSDLIERQDAIDAVNNAFDRETLLTGFVRSIAVRAIRDVPSADEPSQVARDIATIIENEQDMRILPNRSLWFRIGETCVDESKGFISAERAVEKIRELLREER